MASRNELRAAQAQTMLEAELLAQVRGLARALGWLSYHTHRSDRSDPGFPDLVLVNGRQLLFRELKTTTGRLTGYQVHWLTALHAAGQDAAVWRPADLLAGRIARQLGAKAPQ